MSISSAFNSSRSGLAVTEKWAELTSSNIANANRAGYVRKGINLASSDVAGGLRVVGIRRDVDASLDRIFRQEVGRMGRQDAVASYLETYSAQLGQPDSGLTLSSRLAGMQSAFDLMAGNPGDPAIQSNVLSAVEDMAQSLNRTSGDLAETKRAVQTGIARDVEGLNKLLQRIGGLNAEIARQEDGTANRAGLEDEIGSALDELSGLMDFTLRRDAQGRAEIFTRGGTPLVEGQTAETVTYDAQAGRLAAAGIDITPGKSGTRSFGEGSLAGAMELQNEILPQMQRQLDEFARALIQGFEQAEGLAPGVAGLFTDDGAAFDPAALEGLAGRIKVNDAVRPEAGGDLWRIRDGVSAPAEGAAGDSSLIRAFLTVLDTPQGFDGAAGLGETARLDDYAAGLISAQQTVRVDAQNDLASLSLGADAMAAQRSGLQGVNVDDELQQLIMIEQSYAANSQVLQTLNQMIQTLLASV